jgi:outer membrane receptor protein involved in Fe transport
MNTLQKLPSCLPIGLLALTLATPAIAQERPGPEPERQPAQGDAGATGGPSQNEAEPQELEEIIVTGTLIPQTTNSGMSPISVVTSEDMAERGLISIGDVVNSFTENKGYVEGKSSNLLGRFTTGGQEVNIRGLGTGRTLVLLNGRRIADYPLPFGGEQNGVDIGAIPVSALARVELLSSGASAIYGSDAIGGVLNFITKRDMDQTEASVTVGSFEDGVGTTLLGSVITGNSFERGSFTFGLDGYINDQILASEVDWLKRNAPFNAGMVSIQRNTPPAPVQSVLPESSCAPLGFEYSNESCLQEVSNTISLQPGIRQLSAFFDGRYDLADNIELFATAIATDNTYETRSNIQFWNGVIGRDDFSSATFLTRGFSSRELGSADIDSEQTAWTITTGVKGGFDVGSERWHWDVSYSYADYDTRESSISLKEEGVRNWILAGASTVVPEPNQKDTYIVDGDFYDNQLINNIVRPVLKSEIPGLIGENVLRANSSSNFLTLTLDGTLGDFGVLDQPVKFALRSEIAEQSMEIVPDERSLNTTGEGWYNIGAIAAKGDRDRKALALELAVPVLSQLDISLAGRVDHYSDASDISGRFSGQMKFLYRATDWLKLRGGYSQTFRAPDMFNIYGQSEGFATVADFSAPGCFDGETYVCGFTTVATTRRPDTSLTEEYGDDIGFGFIWQPVTNFQLTADWYRIELNDLVVTETAYDTLLREWQCDNDVLDTSSQLCADVRSRITRNGFGAVEQVITQPINQDSAEREGIDLRASTSFESERLGVFSADLSFSKVLKFDLNQFAGDETLDLRYGQIGQATPENSLALTLSWNNPLSAGKAVGAAMFIQRNDGIYNFSQTQFMEPMYNVNLTGRYQFSAQGEVSLTINNLLYTSPQDNGGGLWPYFWPQLQIGSALGRAAYLSLRYSFD